MDKNTPIKPKISEDGWYAYCPICGYFDLLPETDSSCPKCEQTLDWQWYYELRNKRNK